jgi:peroxiredoxin
VTGEDKSASPALVDAANKVGFKPTTEPGVGHVEDKPASAAGPPQAESLLAVGSKAPPFTLKTPQGKTVSLASLRGKAVLLELFATWCPHCNAEAPHLKELYAKLPRSKVVFVSIDGNSDDAASALAYHIWYGLPFPALLDQAGRTVTYPEHGPIGPVSRKYGVSLWPTFYVLDPQGRVTWRSAGEQPDALLERELRHAILAR